MVLIIIALALLLTGIVGFVRGRVDTRLFTSRPRSLILFAIGLVGLFASTAPPWTLAPSPEISLALPPAIEDVFSDTEQKSTAQRATRADVLAEQKSAYPKWEAQVTDAQQKAEQTLRGLPELLTSFNDGTVDRFTMWTHLAVMAANLEQAALKLHDLTPPTVLNLSDRKILETALTDLRSGIHATKESLFEIQMFTRHGDDAYVQQAQARLDAAAGHMAKGVSKLVQVKQQLGAS